MVSILEISNLNNLILFFLWNFTIKWINIAIKKLLTDKEEYDRMSKASNPYGDGNASKNIVNAIIEKFSK